MQISKIKQMMLRDARDGPVRPVIGTFYDHVQVNFHIDHLHHSESRFRFCWSIKDAIVVCYQLGAYTKSLAQFYH